MLQLIANALGVVSNWLGIQSKRLDYKNQPDVQAAEAAKNEARLRDEIKQTIANKDVKKTQEGLAE